MILLATNTSILYIILHFWINQLDKENLFWGRRRKVWEYHIQRRRTIFRKRESRFDIESSVSSAAGVWVYKRVSQGNQKKCQVTLKPVLTERRRRRHRCHGQVSQMESAVLLKWRHKTSQPGVVWRHVELTALELCAKSGEGKQQLL